MLVVRVLGGVLHTRIRGLQERERERKKSVRSFKMDDQKNRFRNPREYSQAYHSLPWWWRPDVVVEFSHVVIVGLEIRK